MTYQCCANAVCHVDDRPLVPTAMLLFLPLELITLILQELPVRDICRCEQTNRYLRAVCQTPVLRYWKAKKTSISRRYTIFLAQPQSTGLRPVSRASPARLATFHVHQCPRNPRLTPCGHLRLCVGHVLLGRSSGSGHVNVDQPQIHANSESGRRSSRQLDTFRSREASCGFRDGDRGAQSRGGGYMVQVDLD